MSFIETIDERDANEEVRAMYERQSSFYGYLPNYARVFSHRPEVMKLWADLQNGVRRHMDRRRFEIITFVAAHTLRSTLCSLAHGKALAKYLSHEDVLKLARGEFPASLSVAEVAIVMFTRKMSRNASEVTPADVERLRDHGLERSGNLRRRRGRGRARVLDESSGGAGRRAGRAVPPDG